MFKTGSSSSSRKTGSDKALPGHRTGKGSLEKSDSSGKKDSSSQTELKLTQEEEFERKIRRLLGEDGRTGGRYVGDPRYVGSVARIISLAHNQQALLGITDEEMDIEKPGTTEEDRREGEIFEEEEQRIAAQIKAEEEEDGQRYESEWSEEEAASEPLLADRESTGYTTDDPALENISVLHDHGLTDAEGALSDVNSVFEAGCPDDGDNTSLSSRASSRLQDSDAGISLDSLSHLYDSDTCHPAYRYNNYGRRGRDLPSDMSNLANIRSMSESITRNFGQPELTETDSDL